MAMREECKHFQSRTYASGEVARFCELDLAPEAPWRCPADCASYERRLADVAWVHGSLIPPKIEDEPQGDPREISEMLRDAESVVDSILPTVLDDVLKEEKKSKRTSFFKRKRSY
jgi:hypothetical protein